MRTIGLLGGMSWTSTASYYRLINEEVQARLGGLHSARLVLWSVDFAPLERMMAEGRWDEAGAHLGEAGRRLADAGADFIVLCTNTLHRVAEAIEARAGVPLLHIAEATAAVVREMGHHRVGLLGTRLTMEEAFYVGRLRDHGLDVRVPAHADREYVDRVIFDELCGGRFDVSARDAYERIIERMVADGAESVILGCTEIGLLLDPNRLAIPVYDTTRLHAAAAVERALA